MFGVGIILIVVSAILLIFIEEDIGIFPIIFGIFGIIAIGASKYRPLKSKKNR